MTKFSGGLSAVYVRVERTFIGVVALIALLLATYEMAARYFAPEYTQDWAAEVVIYLIVWAVLLSGAALVREGRHISADLVIRLLPPQGQRWLEIFNALIGLLFAGVLFWYGIKVVEFARMVDERSESSLYFPLFWYYLCMPIGMGMMSIAFVFRVVDYVFRFDPATMTQGHEVDPHE